MAQAPAIELVKRPKVGARIFVRITIVGDSRGGDDTIPLHEVPIYRRRWAAFNRTAKVQILEDWHHVPLYDEKGNILEDEDGNTVWSNKLLHSRVKALTRSGMMDELKRMRDRHGKVEVGDNVFKDFFDECYGDERTFIKRNQRMLEEFSKLSQNEQRDLTLEEWERLVAIADPNRQQDAIEVIPEDVFDALNESHAENDGSEADATLSVEQVSDLDGLQTGLRAQALGRLSDAGVAAKTAEALAAAWSAAELSGEDLSAEDVVARGLPGLDTETKAQVLLDLLGGRKD